MNPFFRTPPITKNLLIANMVIYLAVWLLPSVDRFTAVYGALHQIGTPWFHIWQFITYMFLHGNLWHLLFNMYALWLFGRSLEYEIGPKRFALYYVVCGIGAALIQLGIAYLSGDWTISLIGASGAVMGVLLAFGVLHPNETLYIIPFPFPIRAIWFVIGYAALELMLGATGLQSGVAHFAHIGGMLWGYLMLLYWKRKGKIFF